MNLIRPSKRSRVDANRTLVGTANLVVSRGLCTVTTLRATLKEILPFVNYHLNVGIDHMFLFFDDPADAAAKALAENPRVTCILCTPEHWAELGKRQTSWLPEFDGSKPPLIEDRQRLNATAALKLARSRHFDWIAHIDADELLYARNGLRALLDHVHSSVDFIRFPVLEAVASDSNGTNPMQSINLFKVAEFRVSEAGGQPTIGTRLRAFARRIGHRLKRTVAKLTAARSIFTNNGLIIGHSFGKSFVRTGSNVSYLKLHLPMACPGSTLRFTIARQGYLLHFDSCNFNQWYEKWRRRCDGTGTAGTMGPHRHKQFIRFQSLYERNANGEIRDLYREQCLIPYRVASSLLHLSLMKRIELSKELFTAPSDSSSLACTSS